MCLIIKKGSKAKAAKKDIVCYKVLRKVERGDALVLSGGSVRCPSITPRYYSPFRCIEVTNEVNSKGTIKAEGELVLYDYHYCGDLIEGGVIHTIQTLPEAKRYAKRITNNLDDMTVCECVIPKGAEYYSGKTKYGYEPLFNEFPSYGSKQIKFVKEICITQ